MTTDAGVKRARRLIGKGRYQKQTIKSADAFDEIDSIDVVKIEGSAYIPYLDKRNGQIVYGYHERRGSQVIFHYLAFSKFDYHYGADDAFEWFDHDAWGFDHL